jgi:hypothetical protein
VAGGRVLAENLPYLSSPGSIKSALEKIRQAATPDRVTVDFILTKLDIKGGTGRAILPFLKKIGFVHSDGMPSDLYRQFRNPTTGGIAAATAIKTAYKPLASINEHFYDLNDADLLAAIVQVTGVGHDSPVAKFTLYTLKNLKAFAKFDATAEATEKAVTLADTTPRPPNGQTPPPATDQQVRLNLAYTINLNLPATPDQAVFNAIFRSLKEHLLSYGKE